MSNYTYLSAAQLAQRIPFSKRYIAEVMKDSVLSRAFTTSGPSVAAR